MAKSKIEESSSLKDLRASMGYVLDYYKLNATADPSYSDSENRDSYDSYLNIYKKDAIISGAVDTVAEEAVKNRGYFLGSETAVKNAEKLFTSLDFYGIAEVHVRALHIYGDSFIEFKFGDSGSLEELHNLENIEMWVLYNKHGEVVAYEQRPFDEVIKGVPQLKNDMFHRWEPESVYMSSLKKLGSKVRGYSPLDPALRSLTARAYGNFFLESTFKNFKPQTIYSVDNNINPTQVKSLVAAIRAADKDPGKKILSVGEVKVQATGMYEFKKDLVDILNYLRQDALTVTKVPGIYIGITADSNRGVGEFEANAFQSHLLKIHRDIEKLGNEVLKKAGIKAEFKMKPPSIKSQTDIIDQAKKLRDMGYGDEVITKFLYENGINIPQNAKFEEAPTADIDDAPSREKSDKTVLEKASNLDENGRSDAGKAKENQRDSKFRSALDSIKRFLKDD